MVLMRLNSSTISLVSMTLQAMIAAFVVVTIAGVSLIYAGVQADFAPFVIGGLVVLIGGTIAIIKKLS